MTLKPISRPLFRLWFLSAAFQTEPLGAKTNIPSAFSSVQAKRPTAVTVVPNQKLNPDVLMMESTENWDRGDAAELLRAPNMRRILVQ